MLAIQAAEAGRDGLIAAAAAQFESSGDEAWLLPWAMGLWCQGLHQEVLALTDRARGSLLVNVDFHILRGMAARQCPGREGVALAAYHQALALNPKRPDAHYNLGNLLMQNQPELALEHYHQSLALDSHDAKTWHNFGLALSRLERFSEALPLLRISLQLDPGVADAWCNLGLAYQGLDRQGAAMGAFRQAIALDHRHAASHINMGNALVSCLKPDQALHYLQRGAELDDSSAKALWNLSLAHLLLGDFRKGWHYYESRFATEAFAGVFPPTAGPQPAELAHCPRPGDPPLVVWSEQGLGDAIQFGRYLGLLEAAGVPYEFHSPPPLLSLFQQWFGCGKRAVPLQRSADARQEARARGDTRPQIALMSLPLLFGTTLPTVPATTPYLRPPGPPPAALRLTTPPGGLSVGLVWASNPDNKAMYRSKSLPLALLLPPLLELAALDLLEIHSLQVGADATQLDPWQTNAAVKNWAPMLRNFSDTAHLLQQLDLVISVDTAVAHLAAALAKPTWLLLPHNADYRWLRQRSDSPWYPEMRLFRQSSQGDWAGVMAQLRQALNDLFLLEVQALAAAKTTATIS